VQARRAAAGDARPAAEQTAALGAGRRAQDGGQEQRSQGQPDLAGGRAGAQQARGEQQRVARQEEADEQSRLGGHQPADAEHAEGGRQRPGVQHVDGEL
jgi:hypothetical protein